MQDHTHDDPVETAVSARTTANGGRAIPRIVTIKDPTPYAQHLFTLTPE
jgi:hypothetical protein